MTAPAPKEENLAAVLKDGVKTAWPICLGYFPIGLAFGVIAGKAGLSPLDIGLMSVLVFAGSAQFIAVSMLTGGAGLIPVVMTAFVVNLRHLLMSSSLSVFLRDLGAWRTALYGYGVTDESFAVSLAEFERGKPDHLFFIGSGLAIYGLWQLATLIGHTFGSALPAGLGLEYALAASLMYLLIVLTRTRRSAIVALFAGLLALAVYPLLSNTWSTVTATFIAATLGVLWNRWRSPS